MGPINRSDSSQGNIARVWRTRLTDDNKLMLARANDTNDGWDAEAEIFRFTGVAGTEIDCAFDQNTNVVVSVDRPTGVGGITEIWLYFYDSLIANYNFINFGEGRTGKVLLDDVLDAVNSDVLLFYMKDSTNKLCMRTQRERYLIETEVLLGNDVNVDALNSYVDDVYRASEGRVHVLVAVDDPVLGRYTYIHYESSLYPHTSDPESLRFGVAIRPTGASLALVIVDQLQETEPWKLLVPAIQSGILVVAMIEVPGSLYSAVFEEWKLGVAVQSGLLPLVVIEVPGAGYTAPEEDMKITVAVQSAAIPQVVIEHTTYDKESLKFMVNPQSGTLV